jgi:ribosomal protein L9
MTKFQDKSFSVPLGGKAFRDGYDRAFGNENIPYEERQIHTPTLIKQLRKEQKEILREMKKEIKQRESLEIKLEPKDIKKFVPLRDMIEEGTVKIKPIFKKQRKGREK